MKKTIEFITWYDKGHSGRVAYRINGKLKSKRYPINRVYELCAKQEKKTGIRHTLRSDYTLRNHPRWWLWDTYFCAGKGPY